MRHILMALAALAGALACVFATPASAALVMVHGQGLATAYKAAACGDVLIVTSEVPATKLASTRDCVASPVLIDFAGQRIAGTLTLASVRGVRIKSALVEAPSNVAQGYGVHVDRSKGVEVTDSIFTGGRISLYFYQSADFVVARNTFQSFGVDGLDIALSRRGKIEDNVCRDPRPETPQTHPDCYQAWSRATDVPTADLAFKRNIGEGPAQGNFGGNHVRVYLAGARVWDAALSGWRTLVVNESLNDGGFDRITIHDSTFKVAYANGIALAGCRNCSLRRNTVTNWSAADANQAKIVVDGKLPGASIDHCGNSYSGWRSASGVIKRGWSDGQCVTSSPLGTP